MKTSIFSSKSGLIAIAAISVITIGIINLSWNGVRVDLTQNKLYTLSQGTKNILADLEHPITLQFYFSARQTDSATVLRTYARRIQELLEEYVQVGGDKIDLQIIDPEPFSEDEDAAVASGLQKIQLNAGGTELFLGLVGKREGGKAETIAFFHPDRESFLEQDISKLIFSASRGRKAVLGIYSSLDVNGGFDMRTQRPSPPCTAIAQLGRLYEIRDLKLSDTVIADDIDLLLLIQPGTLSDSLLYAIDQYVLRGGSAMVFADPINDLAQMTRGSGALPEADKAIDKLLTQWGVKLNRDTILGDARHSLTIGRGQNQSPIRHLAISAFGQNNFPQEDTITNKLETLHVASSGTLTAVEGSDNQFTPLIVSSGESMLLSRDNFEPIPAPEKMYEGFQPTGENYIVAARITGEFQTAFPDGYTPPEPEEDEQQEETDTSQAEETKVESEPGAPAIEHIGQSNKPANIVIVADSDMLTDRLWVQLQQFFGQQIAQPFADNGNFMLNAVDNLLGNADLISIRGRGQFARPFTVVETLRREADARFQNKERELLARLDETEAKLSELQSEKAEGEDTLALSDEQVSTLEQFRQEQLKIRKELREVRHQLGSDIEKLGSWLKFINIAAVPILLTIFALMFKGRRKARLAPH